MDINFLLNHPSKSETFILPTDEKNVREFNGEEEAHLSLGEIDDSKEPQKVSPSEALELLDLVKLYFLQQNDNHRENLTRN